MGPDNMVRLYVGGLPGDVSPAQVAQRFQPFGTIAAVELVPEKGVVTAEPRRALSACRGFAYVQLTPKDAAALHRCISMYNGCKWLGGVLRVEVARPDFRARFEAEEQAERALAGAEQLPSATPPGARGAEAAGEKAAAPPLRILRRDGTKTMRVEPNQARTYFPPVRQRAAGELSWEQPAAPPGFARLERVHNAAPPVLAPRPQILAPAATAVTAGPSAQDGRKGRRGAPPQQELGDGRLQTQSAAPDRRQVAQRGPAVAEALEKEEGEGGSDGSEPELEAVDFFSPEEAASLLPAAAAADRRFDSSSDDDNIGAGEDSPGQAPKVQSAGLEIRHSMPAQDEGLRACQTTIMQRDSAPALQPRRSEEEGLGVASQVGADALQGDANDMPADNSNEEEDEEVEAAAGLEVEPASEHADEGSDDTAGESSEQSEGVAVPGLPPAQSSSGAEENPSEATSDEERIHEQSDTSASGEPETGPVESVQHAGAPDEAASGRGHAQPEEAPDPRAARHDAGHEAATSDREDAGEPEQALDDAAGSPMVPGPPHAAGPQGDAEAQLLASLALALPKGAAFCRRAGDDKVEAAWQAARESMVADYKSKRRMALRQQTAQRKRPRR